jgi:hypothetical protein
MDVFGKSAHVLHDEVRFFEDMRVNALKDELFLRVACDDVGVVDVAVAKFLDPGDGPARCELLCDGFQIFQRYASISTRPCELEPASSDGFYYS